MLSVLLLQPIDVRQIQDKYPQKKGGLKELYEKGPQEAFFLVKFWADLNTNISDEAGSFYGVSATYESQENMTIQCSTKVCSFGKQVGACSLFSFSYFIKILEQPSLLINT